jgi:hypothetical protein
LDGLVVGAWCVVVFTILWWSGAPWWWANLLLLGAPTAYLFVRVPEARAAVRPWFVVKYTLYVSVFFNYLCVRYGAWAGPTSFPHLPGGVVVEQVVWCMLMILSVIAVHCAFFERGHQALPVRWPRTVLSLFFFAGFAIALVPAFQRPLRDYVYLKVGLVLYPLIFVVTALVGVGLLRALAPTMLVWAAFNFAFELLALHNGFWTFPGQYVGWVHVGDLRFPVEEAIFMVLLVAPAILATNSVYLNWKAAAALR